MTNPTETTVANHAATTAQLLTLVSELRGLRDRASQQRGRAVTFAEIAHSSVAGKGTNSHSFHQFLEDLAEILDTNTPQDVDGELATQWRTAVREWLAQQF